MYPFLAMARFVLALLALGNSVSSLQEVCFFNDESACALSDLRPMTWTTIVLNESRATGCMFNTLFHSPYEFEVFVGSTNKAILQISGAGGLGVDTFAVLDYLNFVGVPGISGFADSAPNIGLPKAGIYNQTDPRNPFNNYTIIRAPDCTGDFGVGNSLRDINIPIAFFDRLLADSLAAQNITFTQLLASVGLIDGILPISYTGYNNTRAVVEYFKGQLGDYLESTLTQLTVTGYSAGAIGLMTSWAPEVLQGVHAEHVLILSDGYGLIRNDSCFQEVLADNIHSIGGCQSLPQSFQRDCANGNPLSPQLIYAETLNQIGAEAVVLEVHAKRDSQFAAYYQSIAFLSPTLPESCAGPSDIIFSTEDMYYQLANAHFHAVSTLSTTQNFVIYYVNDTVHTYTAFLSVVQFQDPVTGIFNATLFPTPYYTAHPNGAFTSPPLEPLLVDYFAEILEMESGEICSVCSGTLIDAELLTSQTECDAVLTQTCIDL